MYTPGVENSSAGVSSSSSWLTSSARSGPSGLAASCSTTREPRNRSSSLISRNSWLSSDASR
jgi:hypothetical protein